MAAFFSSTQTRTGGRSRFSKALPSVPADRPMSKQLPQLPQLPPLALDTEERTLITMPSLTSLKPMDSPLPPVPVPSKPATTTTTIPRRPVGQASDAASTKTSSKPAAPAAASKVAVESEPSPVHSTSSILSAYSRTSGESLVRSEDAEGDGSLKGSEPTLSPRQEGKRRREFVPAPLSTSREPSPMMATRPLPPPPAETPTPPPHIPDAKPASPLSPQIWRRRSLRAERNIDVSDLRIENSHGSTAASLPSASGPAPAANSPATFTPASATAAPRLSPFPQGLPGRNIRPSASQSSLASDAMGQGASKLKNKLRPDGQQAAKPRTELPQPPKRLPTPDYEREDVKTPILDSVVSPISPASSPEPPRADAEAEAKTKQQQQLESLRQVAPRQDATDLHAARSLPDLKIRRKQQQQQPQPQEPVAEPQTTRAAQDPTAHPGEQAAASRRQSPGEVSQFPPRSSSTSQGVAPWKAASRGPATGDAVAAAVAPPPAKEMRPVPPRAAETRSERSDETVRPEQPRRLEQGQEGQAEEEEQEDDGNEDDDEPDFDPLAAYFPSMENFQPYTPGTILRPNALRDSHYKCYHRHRRMDRVPNKNYPLMCQTCDRADTEDRWKCQWCNLRICDPCVRVFNSNQRDLARLVEHLASSPASMTASMPASRPASSAGLETVPE